jgi:type VII secretion protein EccB
MRIDPSRTQRLMLMVSALIAVLVLVGALVLGWLRPAGRVGESPIVADRRGGALFVAVDSRLHPVLNLVSGRLIAGDAVDPTFVGAEELAKWPRGALVGIVGAPVESPAVAAPEVSRWSVCDTAAERLGARPVVTGIDGGLTLGDRARVLAAGEAVVGEFDGEAFVVTDGVRMKVDLNDRAVTGALGLAGSGVRPVPMSQALVDALPAGRALEVPRVPGWGEPTRIGIAGVVIGSVVVSQDVASGADQHFVVLADGVQPVSAVVAAMIRQRDSFGAATPVRVAPDRLAEIAVRSVLDVGYYPQDPLRVVDWRAEPVTCVSWERGVADRQGRQRVLVGRALPVRVEQDGRLVPLVVGRDAAGVVADQVLLSDAAATFVATTGGELDSGRREAMWLISSSGVRYGVPHDEQALRALGLAIEDLRLAPWPLLRVWPRGPELSREAALTMHDTMAGVPFAGVPVTRSGR